MSQHLLQDEKSKRLNDGGQPEVKREPRTKAVLKELSCAMRQDIWKERFHVKWKWTRQMQTAEHRQSQQKTEGEEPRESDQHWKSKRPQDTEVTSDFLIFIFCFPVFSNLDALT